MKTEKEIKEFLSKRECYPAIKQQEDLDGEAFLEICIEVIKYKKQNNIKYYRNF